MSDLFALTGIGQLSLAFETVATVPVPRFLCPYERRCEPAGRAVWSEPIDLGGCINRVVKCLTCGKTGEESTRVTA